MSRSRLAGGTGTAAINLQRIAEVHCAAATLRGTLAEGQWIQQAPFQSGHLLVSLRLTTDLLGLSL